MPKRETDAVARVLSDEENQGRSAEEVAELAIEALDGVRGRSHRLLVVGQISYPEAPGTVHTVALGPFSTRGVLDGPEKLEKAAAGGSAARQAGQALAWDTKTGKGRGRFMLAPVFRTARDAYDFYRETPGPLARQETWADIAEAIPRPVTPACVCGLVKTFACRRCGEQVTHWCHRHQRGEKHRCGPAAAA